jgi:hypothetical protein
VIYNVPERNNFVAGIVAVIMNVQTCDGSRVRLSVRPLCNFVAVIMNVLTSDGVRLSVRPLYNALGFLCQTTSFFLHRNSPPLLWLYPSDATCESDGTTTVLSYRQLVVGLSTFFTTVNYVI